MPPADAALLARMNTLPTEELAALLRQCVAVPRWVSEIIAARPYADAETLLGRVAELVASLSDAELFAALADHPRIGDRPAGSLSAGEQSGVDSSFAARLAEGNAAYESRFGHIYLVSAAGKDGATILADLNVRLDNPPATELALARTELAKIASLRLPKLLVDQSIR